MSKRNLFHDISEGVTALRAEREAKLTLHRTTLASAPLPEMDGAEVRALRERLNVSRPVFADALRINARTVESWEQDKSRPNPHAALLIRLVARYPETLEKLRAL